MLIDEQTIFDIVETHTPVTGVIHVGAHTGEERPFYVSKLGCENIVWVEGNDELSIRLNERFPKDKVINSVISDKPEEVTFHLSNNGASSSILELGTHEKHHPKVHYVGSEIKQAMPLDILIPENVSPDLFNFLNLDIQGAELKALKGYEIHLDCIDYIYTEVNREEVYKGCALQDEITNWLSERGFELFIDKITRYGWGDAFYVRK